jgi:hypothetical protein
MLLLGPKWFYSTKAKKAHGLQHENTKRNQGESLLVDLLHRVAVSKRLIERRHCTHIWLIDKNCMDFHHWSTPLLVTTV